MTYWCSSRSTLLREYSVEFISLDAILLFKFKRSNERLARY